MLDVKNSFSDRNYNVLKDTVITDPNLFERLGLFSQLRVLDLGCIYSM